MAAKRPPRLPDGASPLSDKELAARASAKIKSLERELVDRSESTARAITRKRELEDQVREARTVVALEQDDRRDILSSMARQYKANHDALTEQVNRLSADLLASQEELRLTRAALTETLAARDKALAGKDAEIASLTQQMDEMAQAFGVMLNETLEQIGARVQKARDSYETQAVLPTRNRALDLKSYQ